MFVARLCKIERNAYRIFSELRRENRFVGMVPESKPGHSAQYAIAGTDPRESAQTDQCPRLRRQMEQARIRRC
jgi:hypothetical protein